MIKLRSYKSSTLKDDSATLTDDSSSLTNSSAG